MTTPTCPLLLTHSCPRLTFHSLSLSLCLCTHSRSSYYTIRNNAFVYGGGGFKSDFEGHSSLSYGNLELFIATYALHNGYGSTVGEPGHGFLEGNQPQYFNNTAVLSSDGDYAKPVCSGVGTTVMRDNQVYSPTGAVTECGTTLAKWQAAGNDLGTTAAPYPDPLDMIAWMRQLLGM